jgi:recombination protein RecA
MNELKTIFKSVDALNEDATFLSDATLSTPPEWIDTGCYALNAILSGSLYKGIPVGRITGFVGPSQTGKTLIINKILANAQKKGYHAVIWDTEAAVDRESAERIGLNPSKTKYYPVETVEACRNQIATFLDNVCKAHQDNPDLKFIVSIDSLGNLASAKEISDISKDKDAPDVGARSKSLRSMLRTITLKAAKAKVPILFSNHVYEGMDMFPSLVKNQSGGKGPIYLSSILVQLSTKTEKITENPDQESVEIAHNISGATLGALTVKNRFIPAFLKTELYLNFRKGLDPYAGLFDIAVAFNVIERSGNVYKYKGESVGFRKNIETSKEFWDKVMDDLEATLSEKLRYSDIGDKIIDDLEKEVENV